mmetsp:Transcript_34776/g.63299  ORF Transcript_34776/g.63299 Transcript_34776/m.63299 type:complete len:212 (-) Transcript_34776:288-923(-)
MTFVGSATEAFDGSVKLVNLHLACMLHLPHDEVLHVLGAWRHWHASLVHVRGSRESISNGRRQVDVVRSFPGLALNGIAGHEAHLIEDGAVGRLIGIEEDADSNALCKHVVGTFGLVEDDQLGSMVLSVDRVHAGSSEMDLNSLVLHGVSLLVLQFELSKISGCECSVHVAADLNVWVHRGRLVASCILQQTILAFRGNATAVAVEGNVNR